MTRLMSGPRKLMKITSESCINSQAFKGELWVQFRSTFFLHIFSEKYYNQVIQKSLWKKKVLVTN